MNTITTLTLEAEQPSVTPSKSATIEFRRHYYDPSGRAAAIEFHRGGAYAEGMIAFSTNPGTAIGQMPTERMRIAVNGNVGIGVTNPSHLLHVAGVARSTQANFATSSDARVKTDIIPLEHGLELVSRLNPVTFAYTPEYRGGNKALSGQKRGFIAQEVEAVLPDMVSRVSEEVGTRIIEDFRVLENSDFVPLLIKAVQELKAANDNLQSVVEGQQREIEALKATR